MINQVKRHIKKNRKPLKRKSVELYSNCCGHKLWPNSTICPVCKEWCKPIPFEKL